MGAGFAAARPPRENVENQGGAVDHLGADHFSQVAGLGRGQVLVEHHQDGPVLPHPIRHLGRLAAADQVGRVEDAALLDHHSDHGAAGGPGQAGEFLEMLLDFRFRLLRQAHADENGALPGGA